MPKALQSVTAACSVAAVVLLLNLTRKAHIMAQNDAQLTADVAALTSAVSDFKTAITAKLTDLEGQIATLKTATGNEDDAAQDAAITAIEGITADLKTQAAALPTA